MASALTRWMQRLAARFRRGETASTTAGEDPLLRAADSLRSLLDDASIPAEIRSELAADYAEVEAMLGRLEQGQIHLAAFGRVSVGKSSLLNALAGSEAFETGVLHGTTTTRGQQAWREAAAHGVQLIDTPGINELSGEAREKLAFEVARRSDLILFVVDGDLTQIELDALRLLAAQQRPLLLVLNKADRYREDELAALRARLLEHTRGIVQPENLLQARAQPAPERVLRVDAQGREQLDTRPREVDVSEVRARVFAILDAEGKALAALNAALFAGDLADSVGERLTRLGGAEPGAGGGSARGGRTRRRARRAPVECLCAADEPRRSQPSAGHGGRPAGGADGRDLGRAPGRIGTEGHERGPFHRTHRRRPGCAGLVRHPAGRALGRTLSGAGQKLGRRLRKRGD